MVDTARESGTLQKIRSTKERFRKPWRSVNHAARYPVQRVAGRKAGIASRLVAICCAVMEGKLRILTSLLPQSAIAGT
jgi:hypothetical protein